MPWTSTRLPASTRIGHQAPPPAAQARRTSSRDVAGQADVGEPGLRRAGRGPRPPPCPRGARTPARRRRAGVASQRLDQPPRDLVAARDAAEDVDRERPHAGAGEDELERQRDRLGRGAAADVAEVGGAAAGRRELVERAHHETGAVADHADVAVERDEAEAGLAGAALALVRRRPKAGQVRLAPQGAVVHGHLAVEAHDVAGLGDDQRVHLHERRVALPVEAPEPAHDGGELLRRRRRRRRAGRRRGGRDHVTDLVVAQPEQRVDGHRQQGVGPGPRQRLHVHAALGGEHQHGATMVPREDEREVRLRRDRDALLDEHAFDGAAADRHAAGSRRRPPPPRRACGRRGRRRPCRARRRGPGP